MSDHRRGELPGSSVKVLAVASVVTVVAAHLGARNVAWFMDINSFWLREGLALGLAATLALAWLPRWRMSRALRVAVVLPAVQIIAIAIGWAIWRGLASANPYIPIAKEAPLLRELPLVWVVAVAGPLTLALAYAIAWKRRGEWLHAWVMLALVWLLLVGLCAPIVARMSTSWWFVDYSQLRRTLEHWPLVLGIPLAVAVSFTTVAIRRFELVGSRRLQVQGILLLLFTFAVLAGFTSHHSAPQIYANYVHLLLALTLVAAGAITVLGAAIVLRAWRWRHALTGNVIVGTIARGEDADDTVARYEITGWLRGPRLSSRSFELVTSAGTLRVPGNVAIVAELPASSTQLAIGGAIPVLREGSRVALAGFIAPSPDHPFRASLGLIPGLAGITIGRMTEPPAGFAGVALALWRPCIAFLIVVSAVALPGLAAALSLF
jgi:hypothetical protein